MSDVDPTLRERSGTVGAHAVVTPSTVGVLRTEIVLGAVFVDDALLTILGLSRPDALGHGWLDALHPDDRASVALALEDPDATAAAATIECRIGGAAHVRRARISAVPVRDTHGVLSGYLAAVEDLSAARRDDDAVARLTELADVLDEWIVIADPDLCLRYANPAACRGLALPHLGALGGVSVAELVPSERRDAVEQELRHALGANRTWSGSLALHALDGRVVELEATVVAHSSDDDRVAHYSLLGRDITPLRRIQRALDESEARLRLLADATPGNLQRSLNMLSRAIESTPDLVTFHDGEGRMFFANASARAFFAGAQGDDIPALGPDEYLDASPAVMDELQATLATRDHWSGELVAIDGTGRRVPVEVVVVTHRDEHGEVEYYSALSRDLTERKQAESARVRSETVLRAVVQSSPLAIFAFDHEGAVHVWNRAAEELFGYPADEVIGGPPPFVTAETIEDVNDLVERVFLGRTVKGYLARYPHRDGSPIDVNVSIAPLRNHEGRVVTAVAVLADVSEQTRATEALLESEVWFRSLVQHSNDMVMVVDGDGCISYVSPRAAEFAGVEASEILHKPAGEVFTFADDDLDVMHDAFARLRAAPNGAERVTFRSPRSDGTMRWIEMTASNLLEDPAVQGIVVNARDVTEHNKSERALRESEDRYRAVVDDQIELVCRYLPDLTITFVNRAFAEFHDCSRDELIGSSFADLHAPAERAPILERVRAYRPGAELQTYDTWQLGREGARRCYRFLDRAFFDDAGRVIEVQSVGHDVTEERRAATLTANQAQILEQVARGVPLSDTFRALARSVEQHYPMLSCRVLLADDEPLDAATPGYSTPILAADGRTQLGRVVVVGRGPLGPDNEQRSILSLVAHLASIAIERKAFEDRLAHQSMHDPLTGLPNRLLFLDRLGLSVARARRTHAHVAVLFLDLDRFKNVNDSLGHEVGDELLVSVARRLEAVVRPGDTVARFGGDEFTVLCEDLPPESAARRAEEIARRLIDATAQPFVVRDAETFVGVSVGIALATTGLEKPDELLRDADAAMYHAKEAGRGRVEVFADAIRERALTRHATENALHRAIERGELRVFFQPIVRLEDARCIGAEALVRWQHPERGLVLPNEFIPLAEETGLVVPLGAWVLEHVATQAARWQLDQRDFTVSVNLSARQLAQPELVAEVGAVIGSSGVLPSNLCFEITESALMADAEASMRVIEQLREFGVRFAIDDFGTGYSSLGYLKRFSVDTVKIDRAFVDGLGEDEGDRAIVSAVVGLAHALGLCVVAEGVEREDQLVELVALGCDEAQGYFFAPPQPAPDLRALVSTTRRWRPPGSPVMGRG